MVEEQFYLPIIKLFDGKKEVDYTKLGRLIVEVCSAIEKENNPAKVDPKNIVRNSLLLILGLLHKDEPIDTFGKEINDLSAAKKRKIARDLQDVFV